MADIPPNSRPRNFPSEEIKGDRDENTNQTTDESHDNNKGQENM